MRTAETRLIETLVAAHLSNPTHEMHVAFSRLPVPHKWLLFTLLDQEARPGFVRDRNEAEHLEAHYELLCPEDFQQPFATVLNDLTEGFLSVSKDEQDSLQVTWIHPSCRDLTIDELASRTQWRRRFLNWCGPQGVSLALSIGGGPEGKRFLPLMKSPGDWHVLAVRCVALLRRGDDVGIDLCGALWSLDQFTKDEVRRDSKKDLTILIRAVWPEYLKQKEAGLHWTVHHLGMFFDLREATEATAAPPGLAKLWRNCVDDVCYAMNECKPITEAPRALQDFLWTEELIEAYEGAFLKSDEARTEYLRALRRILERAKCETNSSYLRYDFDEDTLKEEEEQYGEMKAIFLQLACRNDLDPMMAKDFKKCANHFAAEADKIERQREEMQQKKKEGTESEADLTRLLPKAPADDISIERLFEDL